MFLSVGVGVNTVQYIIISVLESVSYMALVYVTRTDAIYGFIFVYRAHDSYRVSKSFAFMLESRFSEKNKFHSVLITDSIL